MRAFGRGDEREELRLGAADHHPGGGDLLVEAGKRVGQRFVDLARCGVERGQQLFRGRDGRTRHAVPGLQRFGHGAGRFAQRADRCGEFLGLDDADGAKRLHPHLDMAEIVVEPGEQRVARRLLFAQPRGEAIDDFIDGGDPPGQRLDAVLGGAIERRLIGFEHGEHRLALRRDAFPCLVNCAGGAIEQPIDRRRHLASDRFEACARGFAGRFHPLDMCGELLGSATSDDIGFAPALGQRGELRVERGGMLARRQTGRRQRFCHFRCFGMRARQGRQENAKAGLRRRRRLGEAHRLRIGERNLARHRLADGGQPLGGGVAHRHQAGRLIGKALTIGVDMAGKHGDGRFKIGGLRPHGGGGPAETTRFRAAGPQGKQPDDADQRRRDAERGDELGQRDRCQPRCRQRWRGEPEHRAKPAQRDENRQHGGPATRPRIGGLDLAAQQQFVRFDQRIDRLVVCRRRLVDGQVGVAAAGAQIVDA